MHVALVPRPLRLGGGDEGLAPGAVPVKAIPAETQLQIDRLRGFQFLADRVVRTDVDEKHAQHQALVGHTAEAVELGRVSDPRIGQVEPVGPDPVDRGVEDVLLAEAGRFRVAPQTVARRHARLDAVDPAAAERIVEKGAVIAGVARRDRLGPFRPIGRGVEGVVERAELHLVEGRILRPGHRQQLQPRGGIGRLRIEPEAVVHRHHRGRIRDLARPPLPMEPIAADRRLEAQARATGEPEFQGLGGRIVKGPAMQQGHRSARDALRARVLVHPQLLRRRRNEDWIAPVFFRRVKGAR